MPTEGKNANSHEDRVPWNQLIAYGMGGLIPIALFNIAGQLMGLLGNISLGLSAFWLGFIMIIPRLWDAISDPVMGHLSDNTRSRWGRRRPYILLGSIAVAFSFVAMWWVPRGGEVEAMFPSEAAYNWFQLAFILAGLLVFFTACSHVICLLWLVERNVSAAIATPDYPASVRLCHPSGCLSSIFIDLSSQ